MFALKKQHRFVLICILAAVSACGNESDSNNQNAGTTPSPGAANEQAAVDSTTQSVPTGSESVPASGNLSPDSTGSASGLDTSSTQPSGIDSTSTQATDAESTGAETTGAELPPGSEPTDNETTDTEPTSSGPTETDATGTEPTSTEPSNNEVTDTEPTGTEPSDNEATDTEPTSSEPSDNEVTDTEPTGTEPSDNEPTDTESTGTEPSDNEATNTEPTSTEPSDNEPTDTEPTGTEPSDNEPTDTESTGTDQQPPPVVDCSASATQVRDSTLYLINQVRSQGRMCGSDFFASAPPVVWSSELQAAALSHSNDMAQFNFFSHTGSDGSSVAQRATNQGYNWTAIGENIAAGQASTEQVVQGWTASPGHCANLMNPNFEEIAVGCTQNNTSQFGQYWTNVLGKQTPN